MRIRIKNRGVWTDKRIRIEGNIDNIVLKEDLLHPENERTMIFFRKAATSGVLELSRREAEGMLNSLRGKLNLIKKSRRII